MGRNLKLYEFLAIIVIGLLCYYTYHSIIALGYLEGEDNIGSLIKLGVVIISLFTVWASSPNKQTKFTTFWWAWMIWLFCDFFVLGLRGDGVSNIISVIFAPLTFLFFYIASLHSEKINKIVTIGFLTMFVIAFIMNLSFLSYIQIRITEMSVTNLIYWCLCAVPFIFLIEKKWIMYIFIVATTIVILLTGKRSAFICLLLIYCVILWSLRIGGFKRRNYIILIAGGLSLLYILNHYFSFAIEGIIERMNQIEDSQGSGRIPLYQDVFRVIDTNTLPDWLVGRGYGSIRLTQHTNAHNDALQMLFEYGLIGLVFYVLMLTNAIKRTIILYKHNSQYFTGYMVSLIIFVVLGLVSNLVVFYSYFAFICAYWGLAEHEISQYSVNK